jgi:predicted metalloprotease
VTFSEGGNFEGGRVRTRRGGRGAAVGGGGAGLAIVAFLIYQFTGVNVSPYLEDLGGAGTGTSGELGVVPECTVQDANTNRECRLSATLYSLDAFWSDYLPEQGQEWVKPDAESFEGATTTGCGDATSSTGPFYCPADQDIYLDVSFFDLLQSQFGASGGPFAEMYVIAHEYGHHIQNLAGGMEGIDRTSTGADSDGVRLELQADCYAGMWAQDAVTRLRPGQEVTFLDQITAEELQDALSAAEAVGDDHIQEQSGVGVNSDSWTHGSSEQRKSWFTTGYQEGTSAACDTFSTDDL